MLPQIWWVITAPFRSMEHWYRSEAHSVVRFLEEITLQTQQWPGRVWYYASLNQNACLILLDSEVIVCDDRSEKHEKPDHLRLPASGWDPRPSLPSPRQRWRLGCLHWPPSPLSFKRRRGKQNPGLQHASSIIFPEGVESGEAGRRIKTLHTRSLGSFPARQNTNTPREKHVFLSSGTSGLGRNTQDTH